MTDLLLVTPHSLLTLEQVRAYLRCSRETAKAVVAGLTPVSVGRPVYLASEVLERARELSDPTQQAANQRPRKRAVGSLDRTDDDVL